MNSLIATSSLGPRAPASASTIGGSAVSLFSNKAFAADPAVMKAGGGKAKHVINLYMSGGLSLTSLSVDLDLTRFPLLGASELHIASGSEIWIDPVLGIVFNF